MLLVSLSLWAYLGTFALLALFVGGWIWLWLPSHKPALEAAGRMPLEDDAEGTP